jgi:hypothetical protein
MTKYNYGPAEEPFAQQKALIRIADALDRAYPPAPVHARVDELFDDPKSDPVAFVMDLWGEKREDAEKIVASCQAPPQEELTSPRRKTR